VPERNGRVSGAPAEVEVLILDSLVDEYGVLDYINIDVEVV
jgi:hypothetical protein